MASQLQALLKRELDRKQFLIESGGVMLTLVGLGGLIKLLTTPERIAGYGASAYGGAQAPTKGRLS